MKDKYINHNNTSIHYKTTGKGLPVVLIHGFAEDSTIWNNQVEFLKNDYNLILPDLPGSGKSGLIEAPLSLVVEDPDNFGGEGLGLRAVGQTPLSFGEGLGVRSIVIEDYAACIKQILVEEKIDRCIMIGHSMGGYITLAFAEKYPESLMSLGLFHSSAYADDTAKKETRKKAITFIEANGAEAFLKTSIPGLFYNQGNSKLADALIQSVVRPLKVARQLSQLDQALIQYYNAMITRPDRTKILSGAIIPVLFIMGEHDKAVPFKNSLEQSYLPDHSYVYILRNSAHIGMLEEPDRSNQILAYFLLAQQHNN